MSNKNIIYVFDLDGTIAPHKQPVPKDIADVLNTLGPIIIVTGGSSEYAESATKLLTNKQIIGVADYHDSIDVSKVLNIPKWAFYNFRFFQSIRLRLIRQLNHAMRGSGLIAFAGGRSTIDIQSAAKTKGKLVRKLTKGKKIVFFYDCKWSFVVPYSNDWPLIYIAHKAIRTNWKRIIKDVQNELAKA